MISPDVIEARATNLWQEFTSFHTRLLNTEICAIILAHPSIRIQAWEQLNEQGPTLADLVFLLSHNVSELYARVILKFDSIGAEIVGKLDGVSDPKEIKRLVTVAELSALLHSRQYNHWAADTLITYFYG